MLCNSARTPRSKLSTPGALLVAQSTRRHYLCCCRTALGKHGGTCDLPIVYPTVAGVAGDAGNVVGRELPHPDAHETWVTVQQLQLGMCGDSRPHFFRGVATVSDWLIKVVLLHSHR